MFRLLVVVLPFLVALPAHGEPPFQALARSAGADQPVYAEAEDGTVLVAQAAERPVHPASVSKVATTIALLGELGPDHRFETRLEGTGARDGELLHGDLVLQAGNDPFLVDEGVALMLRKLQAIGVHRIAGSLVVHGSLLFDWKPDPSGTRIAAKFTGHDMARAWNATAADQPAIALDRAALVFEHHGGGDQPGTLLLTHRSAPLLQIVKTFNAYSNNVFHLAADSIGGAGSVQSIVRRRLPAMPPEELVIENGAGAGTTNRLSARAAAALVRELKRECERTGHRLTDVLPVSGIDPGTLDDRLPERRGVVVGKTGTYGDVGASALVGMLRSRRYGYVSFAVLNSFVAVPEARKRQDAFVRGLADAVEAEPWPYDTPLRPAYTQAIVQ